jgi:filamentous hemagglutinin
MSNQEIRTASGVYNFVTQEGTVFIRRASAKVGNSLIGHVDWAIGREVDYAGRLYFSGRTSRGILRKWTNESGHYRPPADARGNACLPDEKFQSGQFKSLLSVEI